MSIKSREKRGKNRSETPPELRGDSPKIVNHVGGLLLTPNKVKRQCIEAIRRTKLGFRRADNRYKREFQKSPNGYFMLEIGEKTVKCVRIEQRTELAKIVRSSGLEYFTLNGFLFVPFTELEN